MNAYVDFSTIDAIQKLRDEIARLEASQKMMRDANAALREHDDSTLRLLGFSEEHISELRIRVDRGQSGFPDYVLRNNQNAIRCLRKCLRAVEVRPENRGGFEFTDDDHLSASF